MCGSCFHAVHAFGCMCATDESQAKNGRKLLLNLSLLSLIAFAAMPLLRTWKLAAPCVTRSYLHAAQRLIYAQLYYVEGRDHPLQVRLREAITAIGVSQQWEEVLPALAAARAAAVKPSVYVYSKAVLATAC
jgi:hypothetical protein